MNAEIKKAVQKSKAAMQQAHSKERMTFKALLLTNPNYFGTFWRAIHACFAHFGQHPLRGTCVLGLPPAAGTP